MNRYIFIHRIKWPVMLVVFGVTALLDQWNILAFDQSWPLYLIAFGVLQLAERAAWSEAQNPMPGPYVGPVPPQGNWGGPPAAPPPSSTSMTITPPDKERM
jgi:hypothetical protein